MNGLATRTCRIVFVRCYRGCTKIVPFFLSFPGPLLNQSKKKEGDQKSFPIFKIFKKMDDRISVIFFCFLIQKGSGETQKKGYDFCTPPVENVSRGWFKLEQE